MHTLTNILSYLVASASCFDSRKPEDGHSISEWHDVNWCDDIWQSGLKWSLKVQQDCKMMRKHWTDELSESKSSTRLAYISVGNEAGHSENWRIRTMMRWIVLDNESISVAEWRTSPNASQMEGCWKWCDGECWKWLTFQLEVDWDGSN